MGEVYLAEDNKLDRKVALKILPADVRRSRNGRRSREGLGDIFQFRRLDGRGDIAVAIDATGNSVLAMTRTCLNGTR